jgi:hypothetical protein
MNKKILLAVFLITIAIPSLKLQAQSGVSLLTDVNAITSDSLTIERASGQKIILVWPYKQNIQKDVAWEELLDDFHSDFKKISSDIPDYDYYHINYVQKKNLIVNQVIGRQTFTVNEKEEVYYVKSNLCLLRGDKLRISIEFTDHKELLDPSLKQDISNAVAQVESKFYISRVSAERHLFDAKNNTMLPKPKRNFKLFVPLGFQAGLLRNNPYIEFRPGIGVIVDNRAFFALQYNIMTQYNEQRRRTEYDHYIGLSSGSIPHGFGSDLGIVVKNGISGQNIALRAGFNFRTKGGILMSTHYYINSSEEIDNGSIDFGFGIGYGF